MITTVKMINPTNNIIVSGISVDFIERWRNMGFEVLSYDPSNVIYVKNFMKKAS